MTQAPVHYRVMLVCLTLSILVSCANSGKDAWKAVDEGFLMIIPASWKRQKMQPIDSNAGAYKGPRAELSFDEWMDVEPAKKAPTTIRNREQLQRLAAAQRNPKLLKPGEEVWMVDGRTASFQIESIAPEARKSLHGCTGKAKLFVPYTDRPGYLAMTIYFKDIQDLPTVRKVLQSVRWKTNTN